MLSGDRLGVGARCLAVAVLLGLASFPRMALGEQPGRLSLERIDSSQGLPHNSVYSIAQDTIGFLWFGTVDGLARWDGYRFRIWRHRADDPGSLPNNVVHALLVDDRGKLWVATEAGLAWRRPGSGEFVRIEAAEGDREKGARFDQLVEGTEGRIWAATETEVFTVAPDASRLDLYATAEDLEGLTARELAIDPEGGLWILAGEEDPARLVLFHGSAGRPGSLQRFEIEASAGRSSSHLWIDEEGRPWIDASGPLRLERSGRARRSPRSAPLAPPGGPTTHLRTRDGTLWIGSNNGLYRRDERTGELVHHPLDPANATWLHNYVRSLFEDRIGALWIGSYTGVYRHDPFDKPFRTLRHRPGASRSLSVDSVSAIHRTADGTLWIGTFGGGLTELPPEGSAIHHRHRPGDRTSLWHDVVWDVLDGQDGRLWVGTEEGVCVLDRGTGRFDRIPLPRLPSSPDRSPRAVHLAQDDRGVLWIASHIGLYRLDPVERRATPVRFPANPGGPLGAQVVSSALYQAPDSLWLGVAGRYLGRLDLASGRFAWYSLADESGRSFSSEGIFHIQEGAGNALWLATGAGLFRFDRRTGSFRRFSEDDGLPGNVVYSVLPDGEGRLWLGTHRGLVRFQPVPGRAPRIRVFDPRDGVASFELNRHAAYRSPEGELFFGGIDGLTRFVPSRIRDNPFPPPVVITEVRVVGRKGERAVEPFAVDRLQLGPGDSSVAFEFAALSFTEPEKNRYAYRLEGIDDEWVAAGDRRFARYAALPPGRYVFRVRAANEDGVWNEVGAALPIRVLPPFWATWWFRTAILLAVATLLAGAYRWRVRRLLEVERLRLRIARDLHDDVSSDLAGIALTADFLAKGGSLGADERKRLEEVRDTAFGLADGLRDIVWYINPEHDNLQALARRMEAVAGRLLPGRSRRFRASLPTDEHPLPMPLRRNLFLVYKEALHNAARHADAEEVEIALEVLNGRLVLTVRDDGRGFEPGTARSGQGLRNMERRCSLIDADLDVTSRAGEGTVVQVTAPLPHRTSEGGASRRSGIARQRSRRYRSVEESLK